MKILQLCKKFPFPPKDGESIAVTNLSKALQSLDCDITLLAMNTSKHFFDIAYLPKHFDHYQAIHLVPVNNSIKWQDAFLNLFSRESYHISRFVSQEFQRKLVVLLKEQRFDVIQLETLYLTPYIPIIRKYSNALIALRAHNVEHEIWDRVSENTGFWAKRWYLTHLAQKLKRFEKNVLQSIDLLIPITGKDLTQFRKMGFQKDAVVTPIGLCAEDYVADDQSFERDLSLSFIGSLDWMPNQEGLIWFLNRVWTPLLKKYPNLKLQVAGRNTPQWLKNKSLKNVEFLGEIPDAPGFINQHSLMVVPLLAGSGMRAKILEGMALGKVVLTTRLGLEGIPAKNREQVLIADSTQEFIDQISYCYHSNGQLIRIGKNAQLFVQQRYDNLRLARELHQAYLSNIRTAEKLALNEV